LFKKLNKSISAIEETLPKKGFDELPLYGYYSRKEGDIVV
jgi:hypothetical protein